MLVQGGVGLEQNAHSMIVAIQYMSNDLHTLQHMMHEQVIYYLYFISNV
jgi:hypothetical protein